MKVCLPNFCLLIEKLRFNFTHNVDKKEISPVNYFSDIN